MKKIEKEILREKLLQILEEKKITKAELNRLAGFQNNEIFKILNYNTDPSFAVVYKIANGLGMSMEELVQSPTKQAYSHTNSPINIPCDQQTFFQTYEKLITGLTNYQLQQLSLKLFTNMFLIAYNYFLTQDRGAPTTKSIQDRFISLLIKDLLVDKMDKA